MYENTEQKQTALLVCVDTGEFDAQVSIDELEELSYTAGAQVAGKVIQRRESLDPSTCVGSGRLEEIKEFCQANDVNLLIFDHELTAVQQRNIERETDLAVIDRTTLILDIFAQRARSKEGKLQVELAQQKYLLPRLMGLGQSLSRLGGGIGTRGPGESKLESDRRHIRRRIQSLEEQLEEVRRHRELLRRRRKKDGVTTVAIVGYTNVGKSTLLNTLTDAGVLAEDKLFATLDPTARALKLPDGRSVMLVDTVGLIRRLPHHLVEAFTPPWRRRWKLTSSSMSAISPARRPWLRSKPPVRVLQELGAGDKPVVTVLNKCDKLSQMPLVLEKDASLSPPRQALAWKSSWRPLKRPCRPPISGSS